MEKISTYPFTKKSESDIIEASWGVIVAKELSFEFRIKEIGTFEVYGWLTAEKKDGKILLSGTEFDQPATLLKGELKA